MTFVAITQRDRFAPLEENSKTVGTQCVRCGNVLKPGDVPSLIDTFGKGEKFQAYLAKSETNLGCHIVHQDCVDTFWDEGDLDDE